MKTNLSEIKPTLGIKLLLTILCVVVGVMLTYSFFR